MSDTDQPRPQKPTPRIGTGSPSTMLLEGFGQWIDQAFGHVPFHVGSSTLGKRWRDVDVRLILPDDHFDALFPGYQAGKELDALWSLVCTAISELGKRMTGLPIDFQIQSQTHANTHYSGHVRQPLMRFRSPEWQPPTAADQGSEQ